MAAIASRQFGRARWDQILGAGITPKTVGRWVRTGYLHRELPRVYAVGHTAPSIEGELSAALLYAGPGAVLSHATALWWWGLLDHPTTVTQVSTPRRIRSRETIDVHARHDLESIDRRGLPVCPVSRALLDFAATAPLKRLRFVLANADYHRRLDLPQLDALTGRGVNGSANLRAALQIHRPQLAFTRSELERRFLALAERFALPIPKLNIHLHGHLVDAVWLDAKLVVEVDGYDGHRSPAQLRGDHQRDLELRARGYVVLRYTWDQLTDTPEAVAADVLIQLAGQL